MSKHIIIIIIIIIIIFFFCLYNFQFFFSLVEKQGILLFFLGMIFTILFNHLLFWLQNSESAHRSVKPRAAAEDGISQWGQPKNRYSWELRGFFVFLEWKEVCER